MTITLDSEASSATTREQFNTSLQEVKAGLGQSDRNGEFSVADYNPNSPVSAQKKIPDIMYFLSKRYLLLVISDQVFLVDRFGIDSFGRPIGLTIISQADLKKQYAEISFKVKIGDKDQILNVVDLFFRSARRNQYFGVTRPAHQTIAENEINLMAALPLTPQPTNCEAFDKVWEIAFGNNASGATALLEDILAHSAYPQYAGIGLAIELEGALDTPFAQLLIKLFQTLYGPRFLLITHLNHFESLSTRLNRPTLILIDEMVLAEAGKAGDKFILECIASDETLIKPSSGKAFKQPNYTHVIVLSHSSYEWSNALAKRISTLSVDPVDSHRIDAAHHQLFQQDGAEGVLHGLASRAQQLKNDFKQRISRASHAFNEFHNNYLLQYLIIELEQGRLVDQKISVKNFWTGFEAYLKNNGLTYNYTQIGGGRELNKLIPMRKSKINDNDDVTSLFGLPLLDNWVSSFIFPDLATCRAAIDRYLGHPWTWEYNAPANLMAPASEPTVPALEQNDGNLPTVSLEELEAMFDAPVLQDLPLGDTNLVHPTTLLTLPKSAA